MYVCDSLFNDNTLKNQMQTKIKNILFKMIIEIHVDNIISFSLFFAYMHQNEVKYNINFVNQKNTKILLCFALHKPHL